MLEGLSDVSPEPFLEDGAKSGHEDEADVKHPRCRNSKSDERLNLCNHQWKYLCALEQKYFKIVWSCRVIQKHFYSYKIFYLTVVCGQSMESMLSFVMWGRSVLAKWASSLWCMLSLWAEDVHLYIWAWKSFRPSFISMDWSCTSLFLYTHGRAEL